MKRIITLILLCAFASVCWGQTIPDVPQEVRFAVGMALAASNTDGIHEEAFKWGKDKDGNVLISMSTPGKTCGTVQRDTCLEYFIPANPAVDARLATVDGFAHVHPRGNVRVSFVQPPSREDLYFAAGVPSTINIVVGADSHLVYFFDGKGVTGTVKLKDFLRGDKGIRTDAKG